MAGSGGDDDGLGLNRLAVHGQYERAFGQIGRLQRAQGLDAGAEALGLLLHPHHQFVAVNPFGKAGKIFHRAGGGEQSARHQAGDGQRSEVGAGGVNGGGQARAARPNDDDLFHAGSVRRSRAVFNSFLAGPPAWVWDKTLQRSPCMTRSSTKALPHSF